MHANLPIANIFRNSHISSFLIFKLRMYNYMRPCPLFSNWKLEVSLTDPSSDQKQLKSHHSSCHCHCHSSHSSLLRSYKTTVSQDDTLKNSAQNHVCVNVNDRPGNPHWKVSPILWGCKAGQAWWLKLPFVHIHPDKQINPHRRRNW